MAASVILDGCGDFIGNETLFGFTPQVNLAYSTQSISVPFTTKGLTYGTLAYATIPKKDDMIKSIYLKSTLGPLYQSGNLNGYCHPIVSDTNIWDATGTTLLVSATNILGFYNTQLILEWVWTTSSSIKVSATNKFSFTGLGAISFKSETAAAFWGFDVTYGYVFTSAVPSLNLIQSGWITGFRPPPSTYSYYDSVGDLLVNKATLYIGGQTIQTISAKTLMIEDDIDTPLENQAGLTITVGRNDTSTSVIPRTYWTRLDFDQVPLSALYDQTVQVAVQFEQIQNLTSRSLNGGILNGSAYTYIKTFPGLSYNTISYGNKTLSTTVQPVTYDTHLSVYDEDTNTCTVLPQILGSGGICTSNNLVYVCSSTNNLAYYSNNFTNYTILPVSIPEYSLFLVAVSFYIFIANNIDILVYDTRSGTTFHQENPDGSPYTIVQYLTSLGIPENNRSLVSIYGTLVGNYIFFPLNDGSRLIRVDINLLRGNVLPGTYENLVTSFYTIALTSVDDKHIYYTYTWPEYDLGIFTRIDTTKPFDNSCVEYSYVYPNIPAMSHGGLGFGSVIPSYFDGQYMYYLCGQGAPPNNGIIFYNTFLGFNDPKAWSWIIFKDDGTTLNSNGQKGYAVSKYNNGAQDIFIIGSSKYIYLYTQDGDTFTTDITRLDPYQVIPSLQSELIVEYSSFETPVSSSISLVNQNQTNTFTIRAGLLSDIFSLTFSGPIREFWIQSNAIISRIVLELNGEVLIDEDYNSLSVLRPFISHVKTPEHTLYTYSIALNPTILDPTGTINISRIRLATINIFLNHMYTTDQVVIVYARSVNVLNCKGGIGGLMFN